MKSIPGEVIRNEIKSKNPSGKSIEAQAEN